MTREMSDDHQQMQQALSEGNAGDGYDFAREFDVRKQLFIWLCAVFVVSLVIANLIGAYLFSFSLPFALPLVGATAVLSAGIIPFPVTFLLTDLINEFYGKKGARFVTWIGFGMSVLVFLLLKAGEQLPYMATPPESGLITQTQFFSFSTNYSGMFVASLTAYLVGQMLDIWIFGLFKFTLKDKHLWVRATGSTVISQIFDSLLVTYIAFNDNMPLGDILHIAASNYVWKFLIAVGITPLLYIGQAGIRKVLQKA